MVEPAAVQVGQVDLIILLQAFDQRLALVVQVLGLELAVVGVFLLGPPFAADGLGLLGQAGSLLPACVALGQQLGQPSLGGLLVEVKLGQVRRGLQAGPSG